MSVMAGLKSFLVGSLPYAAMVMVECIAVVLTTLSKAAMSKGMSSYILVFYSTALGALVLLPFYFFINRKKRTPLTFSILCKFFVLSLVGGTVMQNCVIIGVRYSSPTLASALGNLVPAFTFLLAVIFRMEKLDLRGLRSQMKIMGTLVSIAGALIVTLYKGPSIGSRINEPQLSPTSWTMLTRANTWVVGGIFVTIASFSVAVSNILQAAILKENPSEITLVSFYCFFGTIQCAIISLAAERNHGAWILTTDIEFFSILYAGIFGNVGMYVLSAWCISKKGPVFVALFKPLGISIAAFLGVIFLGDTLHIGSVIGAIIIVAGFYVVMWAQSKEVKKGEINDDRVSPPSSSQKTPLLQTHMNV